MDSVKFIWEQFYKNCSWNWSLNMCSKITLLKITTTPHRGQWVKICIIGHMWQCHKSPSLTGWLAVIWKKDFMGIHHNVDRGEFTVTPFIWNQTQAMIGMGDISLDILLYVSNIWAFCFEVSASVAYRYRKSISIIELFVSIYIDIYRVLGN